MAPETVIRAALRVLHVAAYETRNWSAHAGTSRRVYDLWEALHVVPDLLCRWRPDAESELLMYFAEWDAKYSNLRLTKMYEQAKAEAAGLIP